MSQKAACLKTRLRLAPGRRLHSERFRDRHLLMDPSGTVQLNASAAAILALCDGTRTLDEIVLHGLNRPRDRELAVDVREFLEAAQVLGWIVES